MNHESKKYYLIYILKALPYIYIFYIFIEELYMFINFFLMKFNMIQIYMDR